MQATSRNIDHITNASENFPAATELSSEIGIVGTGPIGLITAIALSQSTDHKITLFGQKPSAAQLEKDTRTTAFMQPSVTMLKNCRIWQLCSENAAPLKHLSMIDDCGGLLRAPDCHFKADEIGLDAFAQNLPNRDLNQTLITMITKTDQINWVETKAVTKVTPAPNHQTITTAENETYNCLFLIGADGHNSICRNSSNIKTTRWAYDQTAIACSFAHSLPHNATSTEIHRPSGPMTLIPLKEFHSSLVWSLTPEQSENIMKLNDRDFSQKLFQNSHAILGEITSVEKRVAFPITGMSVESFTANRMALVGEAAHVLPPIGAQGMNLGMKDIASLIDCLKSNPDLIENTAPLESSYNKARKIDTQSRTYAIDMLNKSLLSSFLPLKAARTSGLSLLNTIKPLRQIVMNKGLGQENNLPQLMQVETSQ